MLAAPGEASIVAGVSATSFCSSLPTARPFPTGAGAAGWRHQRPQAARGHRACDAGACACGCAEMHDSSTWRDFDMSNSSRSSSLIDPSHMIRIKTGFKVEHPIQNLVRKRSSAAPLQARARRQPALLLALLMLHAVAPGRMWVYPHSRPMVCFRKLGRRRRYNQLFSTP